MADSRPEKAALAPTWFFGVVGFILVVWFAFAARSFLVPLVTALFLFTLMAALIGLLGNLRIGGLKLPRFLANIIAIAALFLLGSTVVSVFSDQIDELVAALPRYSERLQLLLTKILSFLGDDLAAKIEASFREVDITSYLTGALTGALGSAGSVLTSLFLVLIYLAFLLAERSVMKQKIAQLFQSREKPEGATHLIADIATSVRQYIWLKTVVSICTGGLSYAVLKPLGIDFAETWAVLIFLLNFIPNIGSILATLLPALIALVQFDTLVPFFVVVGGVGTMQFLVGNVIEPKLMGRSLNLSSFMIVLSLTFWGGLWGIMGMFLSVPITVVILICCTHHPPLRWVAVMLSGDGTLPDARTGAAQAGDS